MLRISKVFISGPAASALYLLLSVALPACGSDDGGATSAAAGSSNGSGGSTGTDSSGGASGSGSNDYVATVCDANDRVGTFRAYLTEDRTIFSGAVSDSVAPNAIPELIASEGACKLVGPRDLSCDPVCAATQACAGNDVCVPKPQKVSVGTVSVTGLLAPIEVDANGITLDYSLTIPDPYPGFDAGAAITLSAAGGELEAFTMNAMGVAPMVTSLSAVEVQTGSAASLSWDASAADPSKSGVHIKLSVNTHGATPGSIECAVPDTGSFDVPAGLVTQLVGMGLSGFPRVVLGRRTTDTANIAGGCVDFSVSSEVTLDLQVDGLISCTSNTDCPAEQPICSPQLACAAAAP